MTDQTFRRRIAHAIHRYDNHHALSGNAIPSKHHLGEADAVLAEMKPELDRLAAYDAAPATTPVPPPTGIDRRAQLLDALDFAYDASRAVPVPPPADQTALRDRIAEAIWERQNPGRRWADCEYRWRADAEADADAVLAVLPEQTDRAAVEAERDELRAAWKTLVRCNVEDAAELIELGRLVGVAPVGDRTVSVRTAVEAIGTELRRLAAEEQPAERPRCPHCQLPHDLTPDSLPATVCASTRQRIADATQAHTVGDHSGCCRVDCEALQAVGEQPETQETLRCVCGDLVQLMDEADPTSWIHSPGSDTRCLDARPRCPHCQMPHEQTPSMALACASIRASIRNRNAAEAPE